MTVKQILLSITTVLVVAVVALAGQSVLQSKEKLAVAEFAQEASPAINDLLLAAGNWAVERGVTNSALKYPKAVPQHMRDTIAIRREAGNEAYYEAMELISHITFENQEKLVATMKAAFEEAEAFRKQADAAFDQTSLQRSAVLVKNWVPTMSKLIITSQELRFAVGEEFSQADPKLSSQTQMKHFSWIMSEYAGRERAIVGGLLSSNTYLNSKQHENLAKYRGRVEVAWDGVNKLAKSNHFPEVLDAIDEAKSHYFGSFEAVRKDVYYAGLEGEDYPLSAKDWIARSTAAIDTLLAVQKGSIHETEIYVEGLREKAVTALTLSSLLMLFGFAIGAVAFYVILRSVLHPLDRIRSAMGKLAKGDVTVDVVGLDRKDEIGEIAQRVEIFKQNAIEKNRMKEVRAEEKRQAEEAKKKMMENIANNFKAQVGGLIDTLASSSSQLRSTAQGMRSIADNTSTSSQSVASSTEQASANVSTVASAMEEMSASSAEIASQITLTQAKSTDTANDAQSANTTVSNLNELVENIGEVVVAIKGIAEQTNLLALNATIEAARAGEAGKGFAVVADEVKKLANETSQKTEEIEDRITEIQNATHASVQAMERIIGNISEIDHSVSGVSAAVEEQNATNTEIVRSVSEASQGVQQVAQVILDVQRGAGETGRSADEVLDAAGEVNNLSTNLKGAVDDFLDTIRNGGEDLDEIEEQDNSVAEDAQELEAAE